MVRVIMHGCNGVMGQVITKMAKDMDGLTIVAGIDLKNDKENGYPVYPSLEECKEEADVVVDFASPKAADHLMDFCAEKKLGLVLCTTGLSEAQIKKVKETAEKTAVLRSANMSLGVNLLLKLVQDAAKVLAGAGFDIEIVEKHHNQKKDAPSGTSIKTAAMMAEVKDDFTKNNCAETETIEGARGGNSYSNLHIHSVRMPGYIASQEVIFGSSGQIMTIRHDSMDRKCYMQGVLLAVKHIFKHNDFVYGLDNIM